MRRIVAIFPSLYMLFLAGCGSSSAVSESRPSSQIEISSPTPSITEPTTTPIISSNPTVQTEPDEYDYVLEFPSETR
jgi:hypothetical protein